MNVGLVITMKLGLGLGYSRSETVFPLKLQNYIFGLNRGR